MRRLTSFARLYSVYRFMGRNRLMSAKTAWQMSK